jgi:hypothetical protein
VRVDVNRKTLVAVLAAAISMAACGTVADRRCGCGGDAATRAEEAARRAEIAAATAQEAAQRADAAAVRLESKATGSGR